MTTLPVEIRRLPSEPDDSVARGSSHGTELSNQDHHVVGELPTPEQFLLGFLRDGRLWVTEPFEATWYMESDEYVVEAHEIAEFGFGRTIPEATADLQRAIAELYFTLEREQERLGSDLAAIRLTLARKIRRFDAPRGA